MPILDSRVDILARRRWSSGSPPVSHTVFTDIIIHPATSGIGSSMWSFLLGLLVSTLRFVAERIVFRSLLWFASLGLSTGHGRSHRTHSRFSPTPGGLYPVAASIDIHTSLAGGFCVSSSHLFLHLFPSLNVSVSPAHFRIACFLHNAPRFLFWSPRDRVCIKGVNEATLKTNHPLKPRLSHVYTVTLPSFRLRATIHLQAQLSACPCLFMRGSAQHVQGHLFVFLDLGTLVIFPLSPPLLLCFSPYLYVSPFWVHGSLIFPCRMSF